MTHDNRSTSPTIFSRSADSRSAYSRSANSVNANPFEANGVGRRTFLAAGGAMAVGGWLAGGVAGKVGPMTALEDDDSTVEATEIRLFQISLAQWSLHKALHAKKIDNLDFARITREEFGLSAVEYVNGFFKNRAEDVDYLGEMKKRADDNGVTSLLIMCDGEGQLGNPEEAARRKAVENHFRWVTAAKFLGCHSIRVNAASRGTREDQARLAADGLRQLSEFAAEHEINVIVENHGGLSSDGGWLAGVITEVDLPNCGTLPDFGNFNLGGGKTYDRYQGVTELMPFAKAVSAKSHQFNDRGDEALTDYYRMMKIVLDAGYRGFVGIEYEGRQVDEYEGIRATRNLLNRVHDYMIQRESQPAEDAESSEEVDSSPGATTNSSDGSASAENAR